jgi:DNA-binding CsgD family transcriptional regulator
MGQASTSKDLRQMLDVLNTGARAALVPGRMPHEVLGSLAVLVRCDDVGFLDMDVATGTHYAADSPQDQPAEWLTEPLREENDPFWEHYRSSPSCSYPTESGDVRTVTLQTDFYSVREWRRSPMNIDTFGGSGPDYEMMCSLPTRGTRARRLVFNRMHGPDFSSRDRAVITLLRPHLVELCGEPQFATPAAKLTKRQFELMQLVAAGFSNAEIAKQLFLSGHTVRTHLENIFSRLGVTNRTAAVARVFPRDDVRPRAGPP